MTKRTPPRFLYLDLNKRCNLRCQHCYRWQTNDDDRSNYLTLEQREGLITEFAERVFAAGLQNLKKFAATFWGIPAGRAAQAFTVT